MKNLRSNKTLALTQAAGSAPAAQAEPGNSTPLPADGGAKSSTGKKHWSLLELILVAAAVLTLLFTVILARKDTREVIVGAAKTVIAYFSPEMKPTTVVDKPLPYEVFDATDEGELCIWICDASTGYCVPNVGTQLAKEPEPVYSKTGRFLRDATARNQRLFIVLANGNLAGWVDPPQRGSIRIRLPL